MSIVRDMKVYIGLDFKRQVIQWDGAAVPMKEPRNMLGQTYLSSSEIHKVEMHTEEPI